MLWDHSKLTRTVLIFCCKLHFHLLAMRIKLSLLIICSGYIAPEYLYRGEISAQSDIYSLGLLIIETTTGEKNNPKQNEPSAREFIERVRQNWTEGHIASRYSKLNANGLQEVKVSIEIGLDCVRIDRKSRPSIESIVQRLDGRCASERANQV
ncbi:unnamed protein product [Triticum turgidum subsp. durum]|uniref:Protein kinase domain-containing protein n=1 Tax=Triticum turgidum subsp. durum TaxID=4567 RepID=A0A9R0W8X3_TRITD|nr:unnamed protein product [Triticum turgidum subsp. durum]